MSPRPLVPARTVLLAVSIVALVTVLAGCAGRGGGSSTPSTAPGAIAHPTGATDALVALGALRDRLLAFGSTATGAVPWSPDRYRGTLLDTPSGPGRPWPWTTFSPVTFTNVSDEASLTFPTRLMSKAEVAALGIERLEGGAQAIVLRSLDPYGGFVSLNLRPLLPDEAN